MDLSSHEPRCTGSAWPSEDSMTATSRAALRVTWITCLLAVCATTVLAQSTVRVTHDDATIWNPGFQTAAVVVPAGTVLAVVARRGDWYEVSLPVVDAEGATATGFIFKGS